MENDSTYHEEQVRQRAFELWEQRGRPKGFEAEFWLQAEREVRDRATSKGMSSNSPSAKSGSGSDGPR